MTKLPRLILPSVLVLPALLLASGCLSSVQVQLLQPATVTLPAEVERLGVVDRSEIANAGEGFLSTMEGLATGETILGDREGAETTMSSLVYTLAASPRFSATPITANREEVGSSLFDEVLPFLVVEHLCAQAGVDALVGLEYFDSDSSVSWSSQRKESTDSDGNTTYTTEHEGTREIGVTVSLRTYACDRAVLLDEATGEYYSQTDRGSGNSKSVASNRLPSSQSVINALGRSIGEDYGRRIAPSWVEERRVYYVDKDDRLKEAKFLVQDGNWDGAAAAWEDVLNDPDPKIAGRAAFNLAVHREIAGNIEGAIAMCDRAVELLPNGNTREYRRILEQRRYDLSRLDEQLGGGD